MDTSTDYKVSYEPVLIPETPHLVYEFVTEVEELVSKIYTERQNKVSDKTPLLSSKETPYYEQSQLDDLTAYSIDARNINKWINYFLFNTNAPSEIPTEVKIDFPPETYTQTENTLFVETTFGELVFEIETLNSVPITINDTETTICIEYNFKSHEFNLVFEESNSAQVTIDFESNRFETAYDEYHSRLTSDSSELHQPFAIYSPAVSYEQAEMYATEQAEDYIILVTNDMWKVCVHSHDESDYHLDVSLVELLNPVSDEIVSHYEDFSYPNRYIHLPEMQYVESMDSILTDEEKQKLRVLPYAVPFGDDDLLFEKLTHTNKFINNSDMETFYDLCYAQFFKQSSGEL